MRVWLVLPFVLAVLLARGAGQSPDPDRDGDGLSDHQEQHKYRTDPARADSDGDGTPDGDWLERREFTYTVRSVIQVMPSYDLATLNDDWQDVRVLHECDEYVELEVIHYPLNTNADAIRGVRGWRKARRPKHLARWLEAGPTTNFDAAMRRDILRRLRAEGIDLDALTDAEAVAKIARWALEHAPSLNQTCIWAVDFRNGKPFVPEELREKFDGKRGEWSDKEMFEREVWARTMYRHRTRGTCTTTAHYLNAVLRAVGIPTRCIVTIPVVDVSDPRGLEMVKRRLTHHRVRREVVAGLEGLGQSFAAHTYNEVWVGGRWHRLNYQRLGQNTLDPQCFGLMTRVHTFSDLAGAGLGGGWGVGRKRPSDVFRHQNPYTALTLADAFGVHAKIANPQVADGEHPALTISRAYWFGDERHRPANIGDDWGKAQDASHGHVLLHVDELDRTRGPEQYMPFFDEGDARMTLRAKGGHAVYADVWKCWWPNPDGGGTEFYLRIPSEQLAGMRRGVRYALVPRNATAMREWRVADGVALVR